MNTVGKWLDVELQNDFWLGITNAISKEFDNQDQIISDLLLALDVDTMPLDSLIDTNSFFNVPFSRAIIDSKDLVPLNLLSFEASDIMNETGSYSQEVVANKYAYRIAQNVTKASYVELGEFSLTVSPQKLTFGAWVYSETQTNIKLGFRVNNNGTEIILSDTFVVDGWTKLVYASDNLYNMEYKLYPFIETVDIAEDIVFSNTFLYRDSLVDYYIPPHIWEREETKNAWFKNIYANLPSYYTSIFKSIFEKGQYGRYILISDFEQTFLAKDYNPLHTEINSETELTNLVWEHKSLMDFATQSTTGTIVALDEDYFIDADFTIDTFTYKALTKHLVLEYSILDCKTEDDVLTLMPYGYLTYLKDYSDYARDVTDQMHLGCQLNQAFDITQEAYSFNTGLLINRFNKIFEYSQIYTLVVGSEVGVVDQATFDANYSGLTEFENPASPFSIATPLATIPLEGPMIDFSGVENGWVNVLCEYVGGYRSKISPLITTSVNTYEYSLNDSYGFDAKSRSIKASFQVNGDIYTISEEDTDNGIATLYRDELDQSNLILSLLNTRIYKRVDTVSNSPSYYDYDYPTEYSANYSALSTKVTYYVNGLQYTATEQVDNTLEGEFLTENSVVVYESGEPSRVILDIGGATFTNYTDIVVSFEYTSSIGLDINTHVKYEYYDRYPKDITQMSLADSSGNVLASCNFNPIELKTWDYHIAFGLALKIS